MATQRDHIDNALNQLKAKKLQLEGLVREVEDAIISLEKVPSLLEGGFVLVPAKPEVKREEAPSRGAPINRDLGEKVRAYLSSYGFSQKISVNEMIAELRESHGVVGKKASLYAYIHHLLKEMKDNRELGITHTPGVGYTRERAPIVNKAPDSELVHSTELGGSR